MVDDSRALASATMALRRKRSRIWRIDSGLLMLAARAGRLLPVIRKTSRHRSARHCIECGRKIGTETGDLCDLCAEYERWIDEQDRNHNNEDEKWRS